MNRYIYRAALLSLGLGSPAYGVNNDWDNGAADQDWNNAANWSDLHAAGEHVPNNNTADGHPGDEDAAINLDAAGQFPIISTTPTVRPRDLRIGTGGGTGRLDITSGASFNMGGGWTFIGEGASGALNHNSSGTFTMGRLMIFNSNAPTTVTDGLLDIGGEMWVGNAGGNNATLNVSGGAVEADSWIAVGRDNSTGVLNQTGGTIIGGTADAGHHTTIGTGGSGHGTVNQSAGTFTHSNQLLLGEGGSGFYNITGASAITNVRQLRVGATGGGNGTLTMTDGTLNVTGGLGDTQIGSDAGTTGIMDIQGGVANIDTNLQIGGSGDGTYNQSGGTMNANSWPSIGRFDGATGEANISGGVFNQTNAAQRLIIGEAGNGTLNVSGTALVDVQGQGVLIGSEATANGTLNLNGGVLQTKEIINGTGAAQINLNGGTLRAAADSTNFFGGTLADINVDVQAGGAVIDSNGFNITIGVGLDGAGGLQKLGNGSLSLDGDSSLSSGVTVSAGTLFVNGSLGASSVTVESGATLGGNGTITSTINVDAAATVGAGQSIGTMNVTGDLAINGILEVEYEDGASQTIDLINVSGELDITNATLDLANLGGPLSGGTYVLATYSTLVGSSFASITGDMPDGSSIDYSFGGNSIALIQIPEPGVALLGLGGVVLLFRRRRF